MESSQERVWRKRNLTSPPNGDEEMNIKIIKNQDKPETREILAEAIVRIGESMEKLSSSGLNKKAIIALIQDDTKLGKGCIETVLESLTRLKGWYCRK